MDKPSPHVIATLLHLIESKQDITEIFALGINIAQLPGLLKYIQKNGYCTRTGGEYVATEAGRALMEKMLPSFTILESRIKPRFEERIPRLLPEDVYIPLSPPA